MTVLVLLLTLGLGYANGANDVSKGIATLVGSGVTDNRHAVLWGTGWTIVGAVLAGFLASGMVATFSGQALLASAPAGASFPVAVAGGAIGWLVIATLAGLPWALLAEGTGYLYKARNLSGTLAGVDKAQFDLAWSGGVSYAPPF